MLCLGVWGLLEFELRFLDWGVRICLDYFYREDILC